MNCAAITITSGAGNSDTPPAAPSKSAPAQPSRSSYTDSQGCTCTCPTTAPLARSLLHHKRAGGVNILPAAELEERTDRVAYNKRPGMLIADTGNGCKTPRETAEVKFPNPGPDVVSGDGAYPLALPVGECGV